MCNSDSGCVLPACQCCSSIPDLVLPLNQRAGYCKVPAETRAAQLQDARCLLAVDAGHLSGADHRYVYSSTPPIQCNVLITVPCETPYRNTCPMACSRGHLQGHTMRFGSTAKVLLKCKLKYYRISECLQGHGVQGRAASCPSLRCSAGLRLSAEGCRPAAASAPVLVDIM